MIAPTRVIGRRRDRRLRYIALGDSYTIGTSVSESERWPNQLVTRLGPKPPTLELIANLAVNGYTSRDVVERELPQFERLDAEFVTVLVGVNDVVRAVAEAEYRENVAAILAALRARLPPERIVAISTPDYTVTPQGGAYGDPHHQSRGIRRNNEVLASAAAARRIAFVDIHDLSLLAADDRSLVAPDGLHPSGAQYTLWLERILPVVEALLRR